MRERKFGSGASHILAKRIRLILPGLMLFIMATGLIAQPVNDPCNMATSIAPGGCEAGDNFMATFDLLNLGCVPPGSANVWFSFIAQGSDYTIDVTGFGGSGQISLMQFTMGPCLFAGATQIDCGGETITGNNVLTVGSQYHILINTTDGSEAGFNLCLTNPVDPPPPPNDDPCAALPTPGDGSCSTGTTADATGDWFVAGCEALGENTVWYSVTLGPNSNSLDINVGNQTILGDAMVIVGSFPSGCANNFVNVGSNCGPLPMNVVATNLTPGTTYYIAVGTMDAEAGIFDLCATEMGPPPACLAIAECNTAQPMGVLTSNAQQNCVTACNTSVSPGGCAGQGPTSYITFTTDNDADLMNINVGSGSMFSPSVGVYEGCGGALIACNTGINNAVTLQTVSVNINTTYVIAITDPLTNGGEFQLCIDLIPTGFSNCADNSIVMTPTVSPPGGPFAPGEVVNVCLNSTWSADPINQGNDCQWLHGITPEFGDCWDISSFQPGTTNQPILNVTTNIGPVFDWYEAGVDYNINGYLPQGSEVPPGWFSTGTPGNDPTCTDFTDPNCTFGASQGCGSVANYFICFDLIAKQYPLCETATDCAVTFRTWGDGETGGWTNNGCELDIPITQNASLNCCQPPTLVFTPQTTCSDVQIDLDLSQFVIVPADPTGITYTWTVLNQPGSVTGAGACTANCGTNFSQLLSNSSSSPQTVTFGIVATTIDGCVAATPVNLDIIVLPGIDINIPQPPAACSGSEATLIATASGGSGSGYTYDWGLDGTGPSITVIPSISTPYTVTVTDSDGCTNEETVVLEANPTLDVDIFQSTDSICFGDPMNFPILLIATANVGNPGEWIGQWDTPQGPAFGVQNNATAGGTYTITVTHTPTGCTGEETIDVTIFDPPTVLLIADNTQECQGTTPLDVLTVINTSPNGGIESWSSVPAGSVDADGNFIPSNVGTNTITYTFTDDITGCEGEGTVDIEVLPLPGFPLITSGPNTICENGMATYCVLPASNASSYSWTLPAGVTITGPTDGECIDVTWGSSSGGSISVNAVNACGTSAADITNVNVTPVPAAPVAPADGSVCLNTQDESFSIAAVTNADDYTWTVNSGDATIDTGNGTTSVTIDFGTMQSEICITANNSCGSSAPDCFIINIDPLPTTTGLPSGANVLCVGDTEIYTVADDGSATSFDWTVTGGTITSGQGTASIEVNWTSGPTGDVCVTAINDCGSVGPECLPITINDVPAIPPTPTGATPVCEGAQGEIYSVPAVTGATSYSWTASNGTIIGASNGTSITVDWGTGVSSGDVCVTAINDCGNSGPTCLPIEINSVPAAPVAPADGSVCLNTQDESFSIAAVTNADDYTWTVNSGDAAIDTGNGTTAVTIDFGTMQSEICITANNSCGSSAPDCFIISIDQLPSNPGQPAGIDEVCVGDTETYTITDDGSATSFNWTVTGGNITSGQGTASIEVDWTSGPNGDVCVTAINDCGSVGPECLPVTINDVPAAPTPPSGNTTICEGAQGEVYSITPVNGATSYAWTVTNGTIDGADNGTSITVNWDTGFTSGDVCVTAINDCGSNGPICTPITFDAIPSPPIAPADVNICANTQGEMYSIANVSGANGYTWTINSGDAVIASSSGTSVTIDFGTMDSEICVTADNDCGSSALSCFTVTIDNIPNVPTDPTGEIDVCEGDVEIYTTTGNGDTYNWTVNGGTINSGQGSTSIEVTWNTGPTGQVFVSATNDCGTTIEALTIVNINTLPQDPGNITGNNPICEGAQGEVYTINNVPGAMSYSWTVTGGTIDGASDGTSITVNWNNVMMGEICVTATNDCGDSVTPSCLPITLDAAPGSPTPPQDAIGCAGELGTGYSIADVTNANTYDWTVSSGDATINGNGGTSVTIDYGTMNSEICITASNDCGTSLPACFTITINDVPSTPVFNSGDATICEGETSASYSIDPISDATGYTWILPGDATVVTGDNTPSVTINWGSVVGTGVNICVFATNDCGDGMQECFDVDIDEVLAAPTVTCDLNNTDLNNVGFAVSHPTATSFEYTYTINGSPEGNTYTTNGDFVITGLLPQDVVEITIIALGAGNVCGNSVATVWSCEANDCVDEDPTFTVGQTVFCITDAAYQLTAVEPGGTWSGTGVTASGLFTPADAGLGEVIIVYSYTDAATSCLQDGPITLEVLAPLDPPTVSCGVITPTSISFDFSHTDMSVTDYEYSYSVNGVPEGNTYNSTGTATITPLTNGDMVTISVVAIGPAPCGNSAANSETCEIPPCVDLDPTFTNIETEYCIEDVSVIVLEATPMGGTWSGTGVDADGTFHPDQFVMAGTTTLTYSWTDATTNCPQEGDVTLNLVAPIAPASVTCNSSTQTSITFDVSLPAGATSYTYTYSVNSIPEGGTYSSTQPTVVITGLGLDNVVELCVVVDGNNICGPSTASCVECISNGCTFITPDVPHDDFYCSDESPITFVGTPGGGAFTGNDISSTGIFTPTSGGLYDITYTYIDALNCESPLTFQVTVVDAVVPPVITCGGSGTDNVTFNWTSGGATQFDYSYTINGMLPAVTGTIGVTTLNVSGLTVNDQVELTVTALGTAPCGNATSLPETCEALDCPTGITVTISGASPPYCVGDGPVQLIGDPMGGVWSGVDVNASGQFTASTAGMSMVNYTWTDPQSGCSYDDDIMIEVIAPLPAPTVSCSGATENSVTFTLSGGANYEYTYTVNGVPTGSVMTTPGPNVTIPGLSINDEVVLTAAVIGASPCGNSPTGSGTCTAFDCPVLDIQFSPAPSYCENEMLAAVQLGVTVVGGDGTTQGTWSGDCVDANGMFDPVGCSTPGLYTVTYTYEEVVGCEISESMTIEIFAAPAANAGTPQNWLCTSTSLTLDGTIGTDTNPGTSYSWSQVSGTGTISGGGTSLTPTIDGPGTFELTVTNAEGCISTSQVVIPNDANAPVANAGPDGWISCNQEMYTLQATPIGANYTYQWTGPGITTANENLPNPTVMIPGNYTVEVTDINNSCNDFAMANVADELLDPVAIITSPIDSLDCNTENFNLIAECDADPNLLYEWYFAGTLFESGECFVQVEQEGEYTLIVSNIFSGCTSEASQMVVDNTGFPVAGAMAEDEIDCINTSVVVSGADSQMGTTIEYEWTGQGIISDPTAIDIEVDQQGEYVLTVTETVSGCTTQATAFVTDLSTTLPLANAGDDQEMDCQFNALALSGNGSGGLGLLEYMWLNSDGDQIGTQAEVTVDTTGTYTLVVTDTETGCTQNSQVEVFPTTDQPVGFEFLIQDPDCVGENNGFINVVDVIGGNGPYLFSFEGDDYSNTSFLSSLAPGDYSVAVEDINGCTFDEMVQIDEPDTVSIGVNQGVDLELELGVDSNVVVNAEITIPFDEVQSITWSPEYAVTCLTEPCWQVEVNANVTTDLTATVVSENNCVAEDRITVFVRKNNNVYFPNAFSPTSAVGENSTFGPMFENDRIDRVEQFIIVDRWGEIVFIKEDMAPGDPRLMWDGTLEGKPMNPGVFVYYAKIKFKNDTEVEEYSGDLTLLR